MGIFRAGDYLYKRRERFRRKRIGHA